MNETAIADLLSLRFRVPHWAFLRSVRNGTGFPASLRTADAMAMSLWPSRGLELHGFEIKVDRRDWLGELKHPEKAEAICQFCDHFWIVATEKVVLEADVPKTWGWMEVRKERLHVVKAAPELSHISPSRLFLASLLRTAVAQVSPEAQQKEAYERGFRKGREEGETCTVRNEQYVKEKIERWEKVAEDFKAKTGVYISDYSNGSDIGDAVRAVMNGDHLKIAHRLQDLRVRAQGIVDDVDLRLKAGTAIQEA